ncbi:MAG: hypothetical protein GKR96_10785 [Gammaproteobacteria bacterium]|nr:hypothetical protein [Gammaproteobacteria bacterium]
MNILDNPAQLVNLQRYPIDTLGSASGIAFAKQCKRDYERTGLCILPSFIQADALETLVTEANKASKHAYFCKNTHNAYLSDMGSTAAEGSIERRHEQTFVGSVPYDRIEGNSLLKALYLWDPLKDFIGQVLGKTSLYRFADPLGACSINVFADGGEHGWHFDESEFTVTLMLQPPSIGGSFEYAPFVRNRPDDWNS